MKSNKSLLSRFFSHNITLLVLAFVLAFTAWFIISASSETETNVTISDIPVSIELPDTAVEDGLKIFNGNNVTASVEVSGNRVTVGSLTASDILVTSNQSSSIIAPGTYTLQLTAKKNGLKTNYNIESSVNPSSITVFVDKAREQSFDIENMLTVKLNDTNHYASTSLSQSKVIVSGPETQVSQIKSVAVVDTITNATSDTQTIQENLVFLNEEGEQLELPYVTTDLETVEVTISVLPITTVNLSVNPANAPSDYPEVSISPSTVKIAGPQRVLDSIQNNTVSIGTLDFTKLENKNLSMKYDISVPEGCKVISGETSATVSVDLSSYEQATVTAKISSKLDTSLYTSEFATNNAEITVYCPESLAAEISASDVTVLADFTGLLDDIESGSSVSLSVPLKISFSSDYSECWVYGTYTTNVNVTKKK